MECKKCELEYPDYPWLMEECPYCKIKDLQNQLAFWKRESERNKAQRDIHIAKNKKLLNK